MLDAELRRECVELVYRHEDIYLSDAELIAKADKLYKYIRSGEKPS